MDERAWIGEVYKRHRARIFSFLAWRTHDREQAEDLTQEVFSAAVRNLPERDPDDRSVLAWLYRVAERRWIDDRRRSSRVRHEPLSEDAYEPASEERRLITENLVQALQALPEGYREIIRMRLFEGRSYREIAERSGSSEAAEKMRFRRALARLRDLLRERGIEP